MSDYKLGIAFLEKLPVLDLNWSQEMQLQWWCWLNFIVALIKS
jgi:hypothetical protein